MAFKVKLFVELPDGRTTEPVTLAEPKDELALQGCLCRLLDGLLRDGPSLLRSIMERVRDLAATPHAGADAVRQDAVIVPPGEGHKYSDLAFWAEMLPGEFTVYTPDDDEDEEL